MVLQYIKWYILQKLRVGQQCSLFCFKKFTTEQEGNTNEKKYRSYNRRDKEGGISLSDCEVVSRELSEILDKKDPIKDNYFLEVSSPGLDRPLKKDKDFERYKGRDVEIKLYKPMNGSKQFEGELVGLTEDNNIKVIIDGEEVDFTRKEVALIRLAIKFQLKIIMEDKQQ